MKSKPHYIKSQVFEVSFFEAPDGLSFQKEFSDYIKSEIAEITERCLSAFDGPSIRVINRLELNLGDIPFESYESTFGKRYEEELMKQLTTKLIHEGADHVEEPDSSESLLKMVRHFLLKGYMPWNFNTNRWQSFSDLFDHLLTIDENATVLEMNELLKSDTNRVRLINQLNEPSIIRLVRIVEPSQSDFIVSYHEQWIQPEKKENVFKENTSTLSKTFWIFIFNYLFEDRGTLFNTKSFLISTLHQIANQFNKTYEEVLMLLKDSYDEIAPVINSELHSIIKMITEEEVKEPEKVLEEEINQFGEIRDLRYFAKNRKWPSDGKLRKSYKEVLFYLADQHATEVQELFKSLSREFEPIDQLIFPLNDKERTHLLRSLGFSHAETIRDYHERITKSDLHRKSIKTDQSQFSRVTWVVVFITLFNEFSSFFNHKSFVLGVLKHIANHYNLSLQALLIDLREGIKQIVIQNKESETLLIVLQVLEEELGEKEIVHKQLSLDSIDDSLLEESVISGVLHPFFKQYGFLTLEEVVCFLSEKEPKRLDSFIDRNWRKSKFKSQLLASPHLLEKTFRRGSHSYIGESMQLIKSESFPMKLNRTDYSKAMLSIIITNSYQNWSQDQFEKELITASNQYSLDFNELVKSLVWVNTRISLGKLDTSLEKVTKKFGILRREQVKEQEPMEEHNEATLFVELVRKGVQGIVNHGQLLSLGFKSVDELLRYLIKHDRAQLRDAFKGFNQPGGSFVGIGRDIPLSTFYSVLIALDQSYGSQVCQILRLLETKLDPSSQSINRFLSTARTLALVEVSKGFQLDVFLKIFAELIIETAPEVYTKVIPVLAQKMSTISLPVNSNVSDFISRLEAQLTHPETHSSPMDRERLQEILRNEFFDQIDRVGDEVETRGESTIIPYFDETAPAVYDEIYIENAGLVLLSSYFPHLFEKLSLIEKGVFLSEEKRETAVLLLQYLMMEVPPLNEHHLPLNKVMCGIPVDVPIRTDLQLNGRDRKIVNGLIEAVIGYWSAIGHSTISGFQGSWLWRKGKLEHTEESWELKVEHKSWDMLLDRYPFTISPVKFSWMDKPLIVEWR